MHRLFKSFCFLCCLLLSTTITYGNSSAAAVEKEQIKEFHVKAALISNFLKYIQWPESYSTELGSELLFGVVGEDPFGEFLDRRLSRITVDGKNVQIKRFKTAEEIVPTHVLYITRSEGANYKSILSKIEGKSVLTVSEVDGFIEEGGIINFTLDERTKKVRFQLNIKSARKHSIQIYPRIVALAEKVVR